MPNLGFQELIVIMVIVLVLFGAKRIPEVGRSMGKGIREFRKAAREITADLDADADDDTSRTTTKRSDD